MARNLRSIGGVIGLAVGLCLVGCNYEQTLQELADGTAADGSASHRTPEPANDAGAPAPSPVVRDGTTIKIASFNIQVFGTTKLSKPRVMDVLARAVRQFDVVAIQEIRSKDQTVLPQFVGMINAEGARYDYIIGPRLGRTSSKEQYAFVYDTSRIEADRAAVYTVDDPQDRLHREPLVARFSVRRPPGDRAFTFSLVNIHTDPDETDVELDALDDVFVGVQGGHREDDVILLGDLNVDEYDFGELRRLPGIAWAVSGIATNTRGTKTYDNIVFDRRTTTEYTGRWGVLDLIAEFNLTMDEALEVSDHLPVWAEFSTQEAPAAGPVAARPATTPR